MKSGILSFFLFHEIEQHQSKDLGVARRSEIQTIKCFYVKFDFLTIFVEFFAPLVFFLFFTANLQTFTTKVLVANVKRM